MLVSPEFRDYLGIMFDKKFYRWAVLPFGLNMSPYYCNKLLCPCPTYLRKTLGLCT